MKLKILILFAIISITRVYAQIPKGLKKTPSGLEYKVLHFGKGLKARNEYRVYMKFNFYFISDSGAFVPIELNGEKNFIIGQEEALKGWDEALALLSQGDSAFFKIPPDLGYGKRKLGKIPANSVLYLYVKLIKTEPVYFNHKGLDTVKYESGLKIIYVKRTQAKLVEPYNEVTVRFTGYVYSTKGFKQVFESSSTENGLPTFQLGAGRMIKGLDIAIATMRVGEKATAIIPPSLGFGDKLAGKILPNTTLYFDIELLESRRPFLTPLTNDTIFTNDSVKILIAKKSNENFITEEDIVFFNYKAYYKNQSGNFLIYDNSFEQNQLSIQRSGSDVGFPGLDKSFLKMRSKECATVLVPYAVTTKKKESKFLPKNAIAYYDIYIDSVIRYPFMAIKDADTVLTASGLKYINNDLGAGNEVKKGTKVKVAYTVYYMDFIGVRHILDSSRESGKLYEAEVGAGTSIKGFDEGIMGMKNGGSRRLIIPSNLAYGKSGIPEKNITENTILYFDIEGIQIAN